MNITIVSMVTVIPFSALTFVYRYVHVVGFKSLSKQILAVNSAVVWYLSTFQLCVCLWLSSIHTVLVTMLRAVLLLCTYFHHHCLEGRYQPRNHFNL